ncbi:SH3 domain signaling protein [Plectosphaerella plurivora]|uniref:SH3 domain signaling protein n=1 Tax=Plectosphaerella plurivora TaxID=936078 RepID=A0A9P8VCH7_9PEZI|nr:SH3 domain signaling protein [Plectosphaerella plurivora]
MDKMSRSFGRLLHRGPGNNAKVSAILKDFEDASDILQKIVDSSNTLRDSWVNLGQHQFGMAKEYQGLYDPISSGDSSKAGNTPTPDLQLSRTFALSEVYSDLKDELNKEVVAIDTQIIQPATDARKCILPIKKTIKKREDKMVAYEKAQEKVKKLQRKADRSPKEETALAKAENEMTQASEEFQYADDHLSTSLPPLCESIFSLVPLLLASLVTTENRLFALYYTVLHNYCQENQFPSPPPAMDEVVADWSSAFQPAMSEAERLYIMASGKAVHMPMSGGEKLSQPSAPRPTGLRRITTWGSNKEKPGQDTEPPPPRTQRIGSTTSLASSDRSAQLSRQSSRSNLGQPTDFTTATLGQTTPGGLGRLTPSYTPSREKSDYFGHQTQQQNGSVATTPMSTGSIIAAKKKPPPPPPPKKRIPAAAEYVIAVHTYPGGQPGDLAFNEGDRIKIIKKTATMDDWWEGEVNGQKGSFPANYTKKA